MSPSGRDESIFRFLLEELVCLLGLFTAVTIGITMLLLGLGVSLGKQLSSTPTTTSAIVAIFSLSGVLIGYSAVRERRKLRAWLNVSWRAILIGTGGGIAMIAAGIVYEQLLERFGQQPPDIPALLTGILPFPLVLLIAAVMAPLGEELYFRGRLYDAVDSRFGAWTAACVTAMAFGLVHGVPIFIPVYVALGLILAGLRRWTGGLVAPVTAHLLNNVLAVILARAL